MAFIQYFLFLAITALSAATPVQLADGPSPQRRDNVTSPPYTLPMSDSTPVARAAAIIVKRATFLYGPGIGGGPFSPTGTLGESITAVDVANEGVELAQQNLIQQNDSLKAMLDTSQYDDLKTLQDYVKLYDDEWEASSAPTGIDPGMLSNYTQDLLFSMERLSLNAFAVRRLDPTKDKLPFAIADSIVKKVSGQSLESLHSTGRLFYVNHSSQATLERTNLYAAACEAYFYINSKSSDFLPLAIKTNFGKDLIYTPADQPTDWLLAKIMFNVNDFWMGQWNHLANTHEVVEIVYEAAIRTLSDDHPVLAVLKRLMYEAFSLRPAALAVLFAPGGKVDEFFAFTGTAASNFTTELYNSGFAGAFQSNYFRTNLVNRGLLNSPVGPALKHFPYYEDASVVYDAIHDFMTAFVSSYYTSSKLIQQDNELQAWVKEAGPAEIIDFPTSVTTTGTLVDMLTQVAHLVSGAHHTVNTAQLLTGSATLPFHPTGLYKQVPTSKGVTDVVPYLPGLNQSLGIIGLASDFARPALAGTNRSLIHMFDDPDLLSRTNAKTRTANTKFMSAMSAFSAIVSKRTFDSNGLSQGMPFVWKALDPNVAPYSLTI